MKQILIVDDDPNLRNLLELHLSRVRGYQTLHAENGAQAVEMVRRHQPDLVLMDLAMPVMNGIQAIKEIRSDPRMMLLPIIFLSSETDRSKWVEAFDAGATDFMNKPYVRSELLARIQTHLKVSALTWALDRKNRQLQQERRLARVVQKGLLPVNLEFPGIETACLYRAQEHIGGDFYDAFGLGDTIHFLMGDISGHGTPSALLMAVCKGLLASLLNTENDPAQVVSRLSTMLYAMLTSGDLDMFVTLACASIDLERGRLSYISAGHVPSFLVRDGELRELEATGPAIGFLPDYDWKVITTDFAPGDLLFMYTDGLSEARNFSGELFGEERIRELVRGDGGPVDLVAEALESALDFCGGSPSDDMAVLAFRRDPEEP